MEINHKPGVNNYQQLEVNQQQEYLEELQQSGKKDNNELKEAVNGFTSIFLNQMFKAMRDTVPEGGLIDGGFAEDVFTDRLDQKLSQMGSKQNSFSNLNQILYRQLNGNS